MKHALTVASILLVLAAPLRLDGQRQQDPLTDAQTEELRTYAQEPLERLKLYIKYLEERIDEIKHLNVDAKLGDGAAELRNRYQEFTWISDELQDNMDSYDDQHADLRKVLKQLVEKSEKWAAVLNGSEPNSEYDFAGKAAREANQSVHDAAQQMLGDETKYFAEHKGEKNAAN